jgi:hypothetical protein
MVVWKVGSKIAKHNFQSLKWHFEGILIDEFDMKLEIYFQGFQDRHLNYKTWVLFDKIAMFQNLGTHKMF